jgi:hypothetical protein
LQIEQAGVGPYRQVCRGVHGHGHPVGGPQVVGGRFECGPDRDVADLQEVWCLADGECGEAVAEIGQSSGRPGDVVEKACPDVGIRGEPALKGLHRAQDPGDRGAQFVGEVRHELPLESFGRPARRR